MGEERGDWGRGGVYISTKEGGVGVYIPIKFLTFQTLKCVPGIPLVKEWQLRTDDVLTRSSYWCIIYRPENKSRTFAVLEEAGMHYVLYLCKMIPTESHTVWNTIDADHVTSVYFTDWSANYWKLLPPCISGMEWQTWNDIETFTKEATWQKMTIDDDISWVTW